MRIASLAALSLLLTPPAMAEVDGQQLFKRCAACHLADGSGVPGAFPSLKGEVKGFAAKPEGRRYLVLVVTRGLAGPIKADGKAYASVMPAQAGMTDEQIAAVLNHVTGAARPFTTAEVAGLRASGATLSPTDVAQLHRKLVGP